MGDGGYLKETLIVYKSADEIVNNSAALQDDNHLVLPLIANEVNLFQFYLLLTYNTGGIKAAVNGPALIELNMGAVGMSDAGVGYNTAGVQTAYNANVFLRGPGGAESGFAVISGQIKVSVAGNLILIWAQNAAVANDTTIKKGSWFEVKRI